MTLDARIFTDLPTGPKVYLTENEGRLPLAPLTTAELNERAEVSDHFVAHLARWGCYQMVHSRHATWLLAVNENRRLDAARTARLGVSR